jgi:hypothetical protein
LAFVLIAPFALPPAPALACGPFFDRAIFIESRHPDIPLQNYAAGRLGIVQPAYAPTYLVVAYEYFSGRTFDAAEQKQLIALWDHYYTNAPQGLLPAGTSGADDWQSVPDLANGAAPVQQHPPQESGFARVNSSSIDQSYANCLDDAFRTAAQVYKARAQQLGAESAAVQSWLGAQETVFQNCSGRPGPNPGQPILPEPADASLPPIIRADRDYQIAAAYFYGGVWDEAEKRFQAIAADSSSPWRTTAALVAARCEIRAATLGTDDGNVADARLTAADSQLKKIIADPSLASIHPSAERLRGYVEFRLDPDARLVELSHILDRGKLRENLAQNLDDYTQLIGGMNGEAAPPPVNLNLDRKSSPMTDWILDFESYGKNAEAARVAHWQQSHSLAWLVSALAYAGPETPQLGQLLDAAAAVPASSPAFLTIEFHRDRLLTAAGKADQARLETEKVLQMPAGRVPISARNLFSALRMTLARTLDEYLQFAPRKVSAVTNDYDGDTPFSAAWCSDDSIRSHSACANKSTPPPLWFDADAAAELTESLPTSVLADAAASTRLPSNLRREVAQAAWVRAVALGEHDIAQNLVPTLSTLSPDLASDLKIYSSASSPAERTFSATLILLRHPELRPNVTAGLPRDTPDGEIDSYRDNWWCNLAPPPKTNNEYDRYGYTNLAIDDRGGPLTALYPDAKPVAPSFLSASEIATAQTEWKAMTQLGCGGTWLVYQTLEWAKAHPDDPRVPEALHLAVRATRYACSDSDMGDYSKQAFTLLHTRYPKSKWAALTPYWFD